jgi:hypothetical protein
MVEQVRAQDLDTRELRQDCGCGCGGGQCGTVRQDCGCGCGGGQCGNTQHELVWVDFAQLAEIKQTSVNN